MALQDSETPECLVVLNKFHEMLGVALTFRPQDWNFGLDSDKFAIDDWRHLFGKLLVFLNR